MKPNISQDWVRRIIEQASDADEPALAMLVIVEVTDAGLKYSFGIASTAPIPFCVQHVVLAKFDDVLHRLENDGSQMHTCDPMPKGRN